ncbi:MAG: hypothetical protein GY849_22100 [Deltaproteobacteria bacterium]|nr:hypothetical protein [Deltaproteobacteria bacterium]
MVSVALVAVDGTVWLLLLVGTTVALLLVSVLLGHVCGLGGLVSVGLSVSGLGGLVSVGGLGGLVCGLGGLVTILGLGSLVAVTVLGSRSLRSGVGCVVSVGSESGDGASSGVVTVLSVRVVGLALNGSLLLSFGMSGGVGSMSPWVLGILTVEVVVGSVDRLT